VAGASAWVSRSNGSIGDARVALTGVGLKPELTQGVMESIIGTDGSDSAVASAADRAVEGITVLEDLYGSVEYKTHLAKVMVRRALTQAIFSAEAEEIGLPSRPKWRDRSVSSARKGAWFEICAAVRAVAVIEDGQFRNLPQVRQVASRKQAGSPIGRTTRRGGSVVDGFAGVRPGHDATGEIPHVASIPVW
jgi:hypothetical protein